MQMSTTADVSIAYARQRYLEIYSASTPDLGLLIILIVLNWDSMTLWIVITKSQLRIDNSINSPKLCLYAVKRFSYWLAFATNFSFIIGLPITSKKWCTANTKQNSSYTWTIRCIWKMILTFDFITLNYYSKKFCNQNKSFRLVVAVLKNFHKYSDKYSFL